MNRPPMLDRTPFVIILDDLQWADAVTLVTQRFLVRARRHLEYGRLADAAGEAETAQRIAGAARPGGHAVLPPSCLARGPASGRDGLDRREAGPAVDGPVRTRSRTPAETLTKGSAGAARPLALGRAGGECGFRRQAGGWRGAGCGRG